MDSALPETLSSVEANNELHDKFNIVTTEMILVNKDMPENMEKKMVDEIKNIDGIKNILSYAEISDTIPKEILPNDIKNIFETDKYRMIIVSSNYEIATPDLNNQINEINNVTSKYGDDIILAGEGPLMKDLVEISDHDFNSVNWVSIGIIFILMIIVLKSGVLPILLMFAIEFAIFINMGIPAYTGETLPFVASIVIGTIQLGATIDYAILITTKYIGLRKEGKDKNAAIDEALGTSINSVVVSALCFFGATFGVGIYSKISLISSLCILMARGAIISMVVVLTVLPALLKVFDKVICKTTYKMKKLV
jgi:predicted RND superfamily exporter protein